MKIRFQKAMATLIPFAEDDVHLLANLPDGMYECHMAALEHNRAMHNKLMKLMRVAFDLWEPQEMEFNGIPVKKNFDEFRKGIVILAGYGEPVYNARGEVQFIPKSLSPDKMNDTEKAQLFQSVIDVLLGMVPDEHRDAIANYI